MTQFASAVTDRMKHEDEKGRVYLHNLFDLLPNDKSLLIRHNSLENFKKVFIFLLN